MNGCCNIAKLNGGAECGQKARGNEAQLNGRNGVQLNKDAKYCNGAQLNGDAKSCNGTQLNEEADCCNEAQVIRDDNRCNGANFNEDAERYNGAIVIGDAKSCNGAKFNEDAKRCNGDQVIGDDNCCNVAKCNADAKRYNGEQGNVDSSYCCGAQLNEDASFCNGAHLKGNANFINGAQWDSNCWDVAQLNTDCRDKAQLNGDAKNCSEANPNKVTNYRNETPINQDIKLGTINGYCNIHALNGRRSFLEAYVAPDWGAGLKGIPTHKVKGKRDTLHTTDVIYSIPCKYCDTPYIGETGRKFGKRLEEHKTESERAVTSVRTRGCRQSSQSAINKSVITDHVMDKNHVIDLEEAEIVYRQRGK